MKNGRIILKATLWNTTPIGIGSRTDEHSDRDVVSTLYPIGTNCELLSPERISETKFFKKLPFIPATSFLGKIDTLLTNENDELKTLWGKVDGEKANGQKVDGNASFIDCSDILITKLPSQTPDNKGQVSEIRDGIRLDSAKGNVANGAKFDYELLSPNTTFGLTMIFRVETVKRIDEKSKKEIEVVLTEYQSVLEIASSIAHIINNGFDLGAKTAVGFGRMTGMANLSELDFENPKEFQKWINNEPGRPIKANNPNYLKPKEHLFEINASFKIKNSLIIRSYSKDPKAPDSTHLKSGGKNILSGSSIKGALRGRAERILNTIQDDEEVTETILAGLFGDVEKKKDDKQKVEKNGYTVPSRLFVDEIPIEEIKEEIQTRIQIDRFTGGTIDGALIEEVPLFPEKDKEQIKNFKIRVKETQPLDKGLLLLLLKDLWTADLPIGGEKSIGRGVLTGVEAELKDKNETYKLLDDFSDPQKVKKLQEYVDSLNCLDNYEFYLSRVNTYKNKRNER